MKIWYLFGMVHLNTDSIKQWWCQWNKLSGTKYIFKTLLIIAIHEWHYPHIFLLVLLLTYQNYRPPLVLQNPECWMASISACPPPPYSRTSVAELARIGSAAALEGLGPEALQAWQAGAGTGTGETEKRWAQHLNLTWFLQNFSILCYREHSEPLFLTFFPPQEHYRYSKQTVCFIMCLKTYTFSNWERMWISFPQTC